MLEAKWRARRATPFVCLISRTNLVDIGVSMGLLSLSLRFHDAGFSRGLMSASLFSNGYYFAKS